MNNDLSRADISGNAQFLNLAKYSTDSSTQWRHMRFSRQRIRGRAIFVLWLLSDWDGTSKTYSLRRFFKNSDIIAPSLAKNPPTSVLYDRTATGANPETIASYVWDLSCAPAKDKTRSRSGAIRLQNGIGSKFVSRR